MHSIHFMCLTYVCAWLTNIFFMLVGTIIGLNQNMENDVNQMNQEFTYIITTFRHKHKPRIICNDFSTTS